MSLFPESRATKLAGIAVGNESNWIRGLFNLNDTATGVKIDEFSALQITAVYACVRILAESLASLPLPVYQRLDNGGKKKAPEHYLYPLLHDMPNSEMSSFEVRETMMGHLLLWGNAYAELVRDGAGRVREIWPLRPDRMRVIRDQISNEIIYLYAVKSSFDLTLEPNILRMRPDQVLHIRGLAFDGIRGYSPVTMNREALGLASATQEYGARFFGNGARPSGILSVNRPLSADAKRGLRDSWQEAYGGLSNAQRVAVLEEGVSWQAVGVAPEEAQFLQSRTFALNDIARMFRVPPHLLQELTRSTNNNIEHQGQDFVTHTIRPWAVRWEGAFQRSLFMESERDTYFAEFLLDGLVRGDMASRYSSYAVGRQWGWLNANEIREKENLNPIDPEDGDGEGYIVPLNMMVEPPPTPAPPAAPAADPEEDDPTAGEDVARTLRPIVADIVLRCIRREHADVVRQSRKQPKGEWRDVFYADHAEFCLKALEPVMRSLKEMGREPGAFSFDRAPELPAAELDAYFENLEAEAPARIADAILGLKE